MTTEQETTTVVSNQNDHNQDTSEDKERKIDKAQPQSTMDQICSLVKSYPEAQASTSREVIYRPSFIDT